MQLGDRVEKVSGYQWSGVVVAIFRPSHGEQRVVVESTVLGAAGALHIYNPEQLKVIDGPDQAG